VGSEFAVFHHALQDAGVEQFRLLDQALDHFLRGGLRFLLDKGDHGDVTFDLNVFAQVEPFRWRAESEFLGDGRFAGLVAADLPFVAQVDAGGGVGVCLQAPGHVVEASVELDCAAAQFPDSLDVLDLLCDFVPRRIELVGGRVPWGLDCLVARDQRVQLDNLAMALQHVNRELARDEARDGRYACVGCFFRHHLAGCDRVSSVFLVFWVLRRLKEGNCQAAVGNYVADGWPPCRGYLACIGHAPSPPRDSARQAAAPRMMSDLGLTLAPDEPPQRLCATFVYAQTVRRALHYPPSYPSLNAVRLLDPVPILSRPVSIWAAGGAITGTSAFESSKKETPFPTAPQEFFADFSSSAGRRLPVVYTLTLSSSALQHP